MDYIEAVLGLKIQEKPWDREGQIPYFLLDRYSVRKVFLDQTPALFLYPHGKLEHVGTLKKHIARLQKEEPVPVVLVLQAMNRYKRNTLISAKIPFVVPEKQLYLPFIGTVLQEKYTPESVELEQFQPAAQLLFFYCLYQNQSRIYMSKAVEELGYSAMSISRAVKQLVQAGLFKEEKDGVQKILISDSSRKMLFEQAQAYLIDPVRRRLFTSHKLSKTEFCTAGIDALAEYSMLNPPGVPCYALKSLTALEGTETLLDADAQIEVELWKYDPRILSRRNMVDPLSLVMSLKNKADDPRIEEAIEELLNDLWEEDAQNGYWNR